MNSGVPAGLAAYSDSADTWVTLFSQASSKEIGIMRIQNIVSQPFRRRMRAGSP